MPGYDGALLRLGVDLADRLLPAFDTPTGVPLSWVNLRKVWGCREQGAGQHPMIERALSPGSLRAVGAAGWAVEQRLWLPLGGAASRGHAATLKPTTLRPACLCVSAPPFAGPGEGGHAHHLHRLRRHAASGVWGAVAADGQLDVRGEGAARCGDDPQHAQQQVGERQGGSEVCAVFY